MFTTITDFLDNNVMFDDENQSLRNALLELEKKVALTESIFYEELPKRKRDYSHRQELALLAISNEIQSNNKVADLCCRAANTMGVRLTDSEKSLGFEAEINALRNKLIALKRL